MDTYIKRGFPGGSDGKESACKAGDLGSMLGLGRSPGEGNGYPLQYSCLENSMTEEAAGLQPMGCKESDMTVQLTNIKKKKKIEISQNTNCSSLFRWYDYYFLLYTYLGCTNFL